jgi:cytochrome c556
MKTAIMTMLAGAVLLAGTVTAVPVLAQDAMKIVKERQAVMKQQGKGLQAVKAYLEGKNDLAAAQAAVANLTQDVGKIPSLFPAGTGMEEFPGKSGAKPAIWTETDKFAAAQQNAQVKANALAAAAKSGDKAAIEAAFADMGKNGCGGCHKTFRQKI